MLAAHTICPVALADGNNIGHQFFTLVESQYPTYLAFISDLQKDVNKVLEMLNVVDRDNLLTNLEKILEAQKNEDYVQEKYRSMVFQRVHKIFFQGMDVDDAYDEGQMAIRKALWNYNNPTIKLSTIFYTYIQSALRDYRKSCLNKSKNNKEKSNYFDPSNKKLYSAITAKSATTDVEYEKSENISLNDLLFANCQDEFDRVVVLFHIEHKAKSDVNWVDLVIAEHIKMYNDSITANAVRNRLNKVLQRTRDYVNDNEISRNDVNI